jgi:hypothetical protein
MPQTSYRDKTILEEYLKFRQLGTDIDALLREHDIKLVLISARDDISPIRFWEKFIFQISVEELSSPNYLRQYLEASSRWHIIFQDSLSLIYASDDYN